MLGLIATRVAPFNTTPLGNSMCGAYHSLMLSAGTRVLVDADKAESGFTLSSSNYSRFM